MGRFDMAHFNPRSPQQMKFIYKLSLILLLTATMLMAFPGQVIAQRPSGDQVVFGGEFTLREDEILNGNLAVLGGSATLETGSRVNGSVAVMGGSVDIYGEVNGSINVVGGSVFLADTAHVRGDIVTVGGNVTRQPGARVDGSSRRTEPEDFQLPPQLTRPGQFQPNFGINLRPIGTMLWLIFQSLALSALAVLVALFLLAPTQRVAQTIVTQPVISGAMGFLTLIIAPALLLLLAVTIILIPISLLGFLVLALALVFGWIAVGVEVGHRLAGMFRTTWTTPISAGVGTLILTLVASAIWQIPCIGWVAPFVVAMMGLGGVIMSRFGTRTYLGNSPTPPPPPPPPVAPGTPPPVQPLRRAEPPVERDDFDAEPLPFSDPYERPTPPEEDPSSFPPEPPVDPETRRDTPEEPLP
jgi:cytoskeletal protein CcmA (bactofilin family)